MRGVKLPDSLEKIGDFCFSASGIEELVLPASVREVGANAFADCKWLKSVRLNEGLERLGKSAF